MHILSRTILRHARPRGFTIIETLVAITILMIAVAGPLVIATKGLTSALASKNQMVASYLAQDTLETIKNKRDGNVANHQDTIEINWLDGFEISNICYDATHVCDINGIDVSFGNNNYSPNMISATTNTPGFPLYYNEATGYSHLPSSGSENTVFSRHFYLEDKGLNNSKSERLVHVIVDWKEGTVPYQIHVTSQLMAISR
jgi:prepilin-type N-terminal cleavage/methylation domain-containing protein